MVRGGEAEFTRLMALAAKAYDADRFGEARAALRRALALAEERFGAEAVELIEVLQRLAMAIGEKKYRGGRLAERAKLHRRVLGISENGHGPDHDRTGRARQDLALDLWGLRRYDEAQELQRRAFDALARKYPDDHYLVRGARGALGSLLSDMGRSDDAIPFLEREAKLADAERHPASRLVAHYFLGQALMRSRRWGRARKVLETALGVAEAGRKGGGEWSRQLREWIGEIPDESTDGRQAPPQRAIRASDRRHRTARESARRGAQRRRRGRPR